MADNFTTPVPDGTEFATKDLAGAHIPLNIIVDSNGDEVSFFPATQPVSAASLPLPSGAATAAKQPALGTAGTASSDVLTVQGIASMTALKVDGSAVTQPVSIAAPVAVTGTFWQATQPVSIAGTVAVSGPLTDAQLRASAVPVSIGGAVPITDNAGSITVDAPVATPVFVRLSDGSSAISTLPVSAASLPLPSGAATEATLSSASALLAAPPTPSDVVTVTPTLDTSAYTAGDVLFAATAFTAVRANDLRALLTSLVVIDKDDQKPAFKLYFFSAAVTFGTANAAPSISDADAASFLGSVSVAAADYDDLGGVSVACIRNIGLLLESVSAAQTVYVAAVTSTTPTHTAAGLVLRFGLLWS